MQKNLFYNIFLILFLSALGLISSTIIYTILMSNTTLSGTNILKISQLTQQILVFAVPAIVASKLVFGNTLTSLRMNKIEIKEVFFTVIIMVVLIPFIDILARFNEGLHLPQSLHNIEEWIRSTEAQNMAITEKLLATTTLGGLFVNITIIALVAAVTEELFFRGIVQRLLEERTNYHIAIWITAIIFSAIHFQFLGFLPRLVLGAMFGYLAVFSESLWLPIVAHFTNNAIGVITYYLKYNKIVEIQTENFSLAIGLISLSVFAALFFSLSKYYTKKRL